MVPHTSVTTTPQVQVLSTTYLSASRATQLSFRFCDRAPCRWPGGRGRRSRVVESVFRKCFDTVISFNDRHSLRLRSGLEPGLLRSYMVSGNDTVSVTVCSGARGKFTLRFVAAGSKLKPPSGRRSPRSARNQRSSEVIRGHQRRSPRSARNPPTYTSPSNI